VAVGLVKGICRTYKVVKDAFVQIELVGPALPQLLVVVVQAGPVFAELVQAVLVDVGDAAEESVSICAYGVARCNCSHVQHSRFVDPTEPLKALQSPYGSTAAAMKALTRSQRIWSLSSPPSSTLSRPCPRPRSCTA
jgi:hypothetical protein